MAKLFGTDGIRGTANQAPLTVDMITRIARAATYALSARKVVLGKDTRLSCYMVEAALSAGFCSMGADVLLVGPMPTPGIAFLTNNMRADAGVVISASHNLYQDNGIKFFSHEGYKLSDELEAKIEAYVFGNDIDDHLPTAENVGRVMRIKESKGRYLVFVKNTFPQDLSLEGVKIVLDCAHGAAYAVAPLVLQELGAQVIVMHAEPDGKNINQNCGAVHPEAMCRRVLQESADIGIALDGDGDRAIFCDEKGEVVDGDTVLAIAAIHAKKSDRLAGNGVVGTVMSNYGFRTSMEKHGIDFVQTHVGDRYIVEAMRRGGYNLGGEQSGHIIFLDHNTTGDGLVTMLQLLAIMVASEKPLGELRQVMQRFPQALVNVAVQEKRDFDAMPKVRQAIAAVESSLGKEGRILVRYSGTEKLARIMVEGADQKQIVEFANRVAEVIKQEIGRSG